MWGNRVLEEVESKVGGVWCVVCGVWCVVCGVCGCPGCVSWVCVGALGACRGCVVTVLFPAETGIRNRFGSRESRDEYMG